MNLIRYVFKIDTNKQVLLIILIVLSVSLSFVSIRIEGLFVDDAIESGIASGKLDRLFNYVLIYLALIVISKGMTYFTEILFMEVSQKTLMKIRTELFNHVLRLNPSFFHKTPIGEIMSRIIPEVQQLGMFLSQIILVPLTSLMTIIAGIGLVTMIDWRLGLISIGIFSLVFIFLPRLRARLKDFSREWNEKLRSISSTTEESISHYQEIQCNNTFGYEEDGFKKNLLGFWDINMDLARVHGKTTFLSGFFSSLATLSVYGIGGYLAIKTAGSSNALSVGSIFVMIRALGVIITPVTKLIDFSQGYQEALIKFDMVNDYLKIPPEMVDGREAKTLSGVKGEIEISNLSFGFEADKKILKNIALHMKPGEHVALVGPAGCGKSTLSLLINRMMRTSFGEIRLDNANIAEIRLDSFRKYVGYVAQAKTSNPVLFGGTLGDNILYGLMRKPSNPSGNPGEWLDLESAGVGKVEELRGEVMQIIRDVHFYDDVFNFGLTNVTLVDAQREKDGIFAVGDPSLIKTKILEGRLNFREKMAGSADNLIEFFDEKKFMNYSTILENIIFTSADPFTKDQEKFRELRGLLEPICNEAGISGRIFDIGCSTAIELSDIFKKVKPDSRELLRRFQIPQPVIRNLASLGEKMKLQGIERVKDKLPPPAKELILRMGLDYSVAYGIDQYIDEEFKEKVLKARELFRERAESGLGNRICFYNRDDYIDGASIRDNLVLGKVNTLVHHAEETISGMLREFIIEAGLEELIITLGLLMDVGERGSRLSGGQAQKTAISRVLLKKPDILILDEATSALDNTSQQKISQMLDKRFRNKNVITIAHRLDTIRDYDRIIVLKAGEIVESGNFNELMEKKGLFHELWETHFEQGR